MFSQPLQRHHVVMSHCQVRTWPWTRLRSRFVHELPGELLIIQTDGQKHRLRHSRPRRVRCAAPCPRSSGGEATSSSLPNDPAKSSSFVSASGQRSQRVVQKSGQTRPVNPGCPSEQGTSRPPTDDYAAVAHYSPETRVLRVVVQHADREVRKLHGGKTCHRVRIKSGKEKRRL